MQMHLQQGVARVQSYMEVVSRVVLAFVLALAGGAISAVAAISHRRLCDMISFAAGTLLGVTLFSLLPEISQNLAVPHVLIGLGSISGLMLISRYVFHVVRHVPRATLTKRLPTGSMRSRRL